MRHYRLQIVFLSLIFIFPLCGRAEDHHALANDVEAANDLATDQMPEIEGVDLDAVPTDADGRPIELPQIVVELARQHARELLEAPDWVKELQVRKVGDYFSQDLTRTSRLPKDAIEKLEQDAIKLHSYYVANSHDEQFKGVSESRLREFIRSLKAKTLLSPVRGGKLTTPLKTWSVETLVVTEELAALAKFPNFVKRAMQLVVGKSLRGASVRAGAVVVGGVLYYLAHQFHQTAFAGEMMSAFIGTILGRVVGSFDAGPAAAVFNALTSWIITPTTEFIKVWNSRYTAGAEQSINRFFDKRKPKIDGPVGQNNDRPKIATVEEDGTNFAYMTNEDQIANWDKVLDIWVAVAKRYGQLLRDTHHVGRGLMMMSWSDEQSATHLIETMDSKLIALNIEAEVLMTPYKTAFLQSKEAPKKVELETSFDQFQKLCDQSWMIPNMDTTSLAILSSKIEGTRDKMIRLGVSRRDMARIMAIQAERANAVGTIVTGLALNEMRTFFSAEANRNLAKDARVSQRAIRRGFHLQSYVEKYLPLVQQQQRRMKFKNSGLGPKGLPAKCEGALVVAQ